MCTALCVLRHNQAALSRRELLLCTAVLLVLCAWTGPRAVSALQHIPSQQWVPCNTLQSFVLQLECRLHAGVNQHYALRTYYALTAAVLYGMSAFVLVRRRIDGAAVLATSLILASATVVLVGYVSAIFAAVKLPGLQQLLPENLMFNAWGRRRMSQIIGNPSWVWPYLGPLFAWVLYRFASLLTNNDSARHHRVLLLRAVAALAVLAALLVTGQRGAWIMTALMIGTAGVYVLRRRVPALSETGAAGFLLRPHNIILLTISGAVVALVAAYVLGLAEPRLRIWAAAGEFIVRAPWTGHGYAAWFQLIREYVESSAAGDGVLYDTAHNLYLQLFAELGLIHGGVCLALLAAIGRSAWHNAGQAGESRDLRLLVALGLASFLTATLIQEVDYILPTFYLTAAFWGGLTGIDGGRSSCTAAESPRVARAAWAGGAVGFSGLAALALALFSWGASAYEAPAHRAPADEHSVLSRWLSPDVTLTAFSAGSGKAYSVHPLVAMVRPGTYEHDGRRVAWSEEAIDRASLVLTNGEFLPRRHRIRFSQGFPDSTRFVAAMAAYPPARTDLGILRSHGLEPAQICKSSYKALPGAGNGCPTARRCPGGCEFTAVSCGRRERLDFHVRPEHTETPTEIIVKIYATVANTEAVSTSPEYLSLTLPKTGQAIHAEQDGAAAFFVGVTATGPVWIDEAPCP